MTGLDLSLSLSGRASWLDRHRPLLSDAQLALFFVGAALWVGSIHAPGAFRPETWGTLAYSVPAECWAMMIMLTAVSIYVGLIRPIKRRLVLIGSVAGIVTYSALGLSAALSGGELAITVFSVFLFVPLHGRLAWESVTNARSVAA